jgi:hypothetical protein
MPCPFFAPTARVKEFAEDAWPLGALFEGRCAANPQAEVPDEMQRRCCNIGYARRQCHAADAHEADAIRFLIRRVTGASVEVAWSTEHDHHPVAVGTLEVNPSNETAPLETIEVQARAYVSEYLRHAGRAA